MVLKKRQRHGISGFHFPFVPKAPRSARRGLHKSLVEDSQLCAFELLASLAGKLLMESESSSASSNASDANDRPAISDDIVKREPVETHPVKTERFDLGSCEESIFLPNFGLSSNDSARVLKETPPPAESDSILERSSVVSNSDSSVKVSCDVKPIQCEKLPAEVEGGDSPASVEPHDGYLKSESDGVETGGSILGNACISKDPKKSCMKNPALVNLDNNVKLMSHDISLPSASGLKHGNDIKLGVRDDDDENLFRFNKQSNRRKAFRPSSRIGDRRIRKLLSSKYWKSAPKLKDYEATRPVSADGGMKPLYHKRKLACNYDRRQNDILYKRRKLSDRSLVIASDVGFSSESVCNSPEKGMSGDNGSAVMLNRGVYFTASLPSSLFFKLSIKSFKIPELFIEVPETATVGSLKRTVVEAVSAILSGGLRVGVIHHGKKVRDDNRTLLQTGISSSENLDTLGFTLEPSSVEAPAPLCSEELPAMLPSNASQLLPRSPAATIVEPHKLNDSPYLTPLPGNLVDNINTNQEPLSSNADIVAEKSPSDSKALVVVEPVSAEALTALPLNQKCRRSENVQRRTRRPFSVTEVEALVRSVEELGTGRWRDVKLRSFDNADHRTYVDLKDKWKTLVHTAKIAPQQRRGEPVPQDLLDRVLAAHGYWSQHQARQQTKIQAANATATAASASAMLRITDGQTV
ncbi:Telomere repeat-binding protein 3 [Linum perenne]